MANNVTDVINQNKINPELGYDPWAFPKLISPVRDLSYVVFGWCIYEALECGTTLLSAREERRSRIYQGLVVASVFHLAVIAAGIVDASTSKEVVTDFFRGPCEFASSAICLTCLLLARWAYFYVGVKIVLDAAPVNRSTVIKLWATTIVAAIGTLCYTIITIRFFQLTFDQYGDYMETKNVDAVMKRISEDIEPFEKTVKVGQSA
ncbi:MAG: hypothetical protein BJ554DRAFT_4100 [Olpidium bornovanus]|uniref:Uncharacterized protein n=1 Tax=Olpidium bornovanus TaxID=278681 RepID=A0A8H8A0G8_9FUNG|nr:MAG: hypothetical protein BJ554DRAFT_4100 [Olpidium bornovanus]